MKNKERTYTMIPYILKEKDLQKKSTNFLTFFFNFFQCISIFTYREHDSHSPTFKHCFCSPHYFNKLLLTSCPTYYTLSLLLLHTMFCPQISLIFICFAALYISFSISLKYFLIYILCHHFHYFFPPLFHPLEELQNRKLFSP